MLPLQEIRKVYYSFTSSTESTESTVYVSGGFQKEFLPQRRLVEVGAT